MFCWALPGHYVVVLNRPARYAYVLEVFHRPATGWLLRVQVVGEPFTLLYHAWACRMPDVIYRLGEDRFISFPDVHYAEALEISS